MRLLPRLCLAIVLAFAGCRFPDDPEGTLERVEGGKLRVGLLGPVEELRAEEMRLEAVAAALGAGVEYREGLVHDLVAAVEAGELDLLAGGLPKSTPFADRLALSRPWGETQVGDEREPAVFGLRRGENAFLLAINRALAR